MKTTVDAEIRRMAEQFVRRRVAMGFDDADDIIDTALDYLEPECDFEVLEPYLVQLTADLMDEHCEAQKSWPAETDGDRLVRAFRIMEEEHGIVARHDFTCCQSCGHSEIWTEIEKAQERGPVIGYTFYHRQDTEGAVEDGKLYLAYRAVAEDRAATEEVARRIVQVLGEAGLPAEWDGDLRKRILVPLEWRWRREC